MCLMTKKEISSIDILNSKSKNCIITGVYRPPKADVKVLKGCLSKQNTNDKTILWKISMSILSVIIILNL